jgi:arabinose-5-phosphate isomerase
MTTKDDVSHGKATLMQEIKGLQELHDTLDGPFADAVECLACIKGRIIVTGMGKSGHVARKIAATMASTGTPAHFVHPGEASHGDLGMIGKEDAVLALSNSGETAELADIINYTKRFNIPLVGIVRRAGSMLVESANIALVLPETPEAGPVKAPTTSTTMMMALGDAIAVALMQRRGFNKDDFSVFHPGGKIGKGFIRVKDLMHTGEEVPIVNADMLMSEALLAVTGKRFGCAGVLDKSGNLAGIITDGDLRRHMGADLLDKRASEIMNASPRTTTPNVLAVEILGLMNEKRITSLFVVEAGKPVGIIHIHDCLRAGVA